MRALVGICTALLCCPSLSFAGPDITIRLDQSDSSIVSLAVSENGDRVATLHEGGQLLIWQIVGENVKKTPVATLANAEQLALSDAGHWAAIAAEKVCHVYDLTSLKLHRSRDFSNPIWSVSFRKDGAVLLIGLAGKAHALWEFTNDNGVREFAVDPPARVFAAEGSRVLTANQSLLVYEAASAKLVSRWKLGDFCCLVTHLLSSAGQSILVGYNDGAKALSLSQSQARAVMGGGIPFLGMPSGVHSPGTGRLTFTKNGQEQQRLAVFSPDNLIGFWSDPPLENKSERLCFYGPKDLAVYSHQQEEPVLIRLPENRIPRDAALSADARYAVVLELEVDRSAPAVTMGRPDVAAKFLTLDHPRVAMYKSTNGELLGRSEILDQSAPLIPTELRMAMARSGRALLIYDRRSVAVWNLSQLLDGGEIRTFLRKSDSSRDSGLKAPNKALQRTEARRTTELHVMLPRRTGERRRQNHTGRADGGFWRR